MLLKLKEEIDAALEKCATQTQTGPHTHAHVFHLIYSMYTLTR